MTELTKYVIMSIRAKKYKKLLQEVKYLRTELEYQNEVLSEYHQIFEEYYRNWCAKNNIDIKEQEEKNSTRVNKILPNQVIANQKYDSNDMILLEESKVKQKDSKNLNKLYRKIAMALHPDKQNGDEKRFAKVNQAYENGKWSVLLEEAIELGIEPDDFAYLSELLKEEKQELKEKIQHNKGVYSWKFYECDEDESCREKLIKDFLKHLFNLEVQ